VNAVLLFRTVFAVAAEAAFETKAIAAQATSSDRIFTKSPKSSKRSHLLQLSKRPCQSEVLKTSAELQMCCVSWLAGDLLKRDELATVGEGDRILERPFPAAISHSATTG
jgi:hypothetical protein